MMTIMATDMSDAITALTTTMGITTGATMGTAAAEGSQIAPSLCRPAYR